MVDAVVRNIDTIGEAMRARGVITLGIFSILLITHSLFALEPIRIDSTFSRQSVAKNVEYLEDSEKRLTIDEIARREAGWQGTDQDAFNFGFTDSVYWMRFDVRNTTDEALYWYCEIGYPQIDRVELFYRDEAGAFTVKKGGDYYPFDIRDVSDRNTIFALKTWPGVSRYYLRFETSSSLNFPLVIYSQRGYLDKVQNELPILWFYYGLMFIMLVYNLFVFFSIRQLDYLYYVLFIASYILIQFTLNGFAFQYLWPNSIWWANNCIPFFISATAVCSGLFCRESMQSRTHFPLLNKIMLFAIVVPNIILMSVVLFLDYRISIKVTMVFALLAVLILFIASLITTIRGSRPARYILLGFLGLFFGITLFVLKTFGVLPSNFITVWGLQIGSTLIVVFLALGLADRINTLRRDLQGLNLGLETNERLAKERSAYLENIVKTVREISQDLLNTSSELTEMGNDFSRISQEQEKSSQEMTVLFGNLVSSTENISQSTVEQKQEGEKTRELANVLNETQRYVREMSVSVLESISVIAQSATDAGESLRNMIERMGIIDEEGKTVRNVISIIDDIVDRINLLSLNAAIEAARAGEYGRGFSVVADEISKLAHATAENSKEISGQIVRITGDIDQGIRIVTQTKESTDGIFDMIKTINERVDTVKELMDSLGTAIGNVMKQAEIMDTLSKSIASSTDEQNSSMEHTVQYVERLSGIAQEISSTNEKIVRFTHLITEKAVVLDDLVKDIG